MKKRRLKLLIKKWQTLLKRCLNRITGRRQYYFIELSHNQYSIDQIESNLNRQYTDRLVATDGRIYWFETCDFSLKRCPSCKHRLPIAYFDDNTEECYLCDDTPFEIQRHGTESKITN